MVAWAQARDTCALLVVHRGRIVLERYWCGLNHGTRVNAWSMAKTVAALAVGAAVAQGAIGDLDAPIRAWIPEWASDARGDITVRQLLQMTSGLRIGNLIRIHIGTDARTALLDTPAEQAPGLAFAYRNINTMLLSLIVERATGQRWARFLSQSVWRPIGARDAAVWLDTPGGIAKTYCCLLATARDWARVGLLLAQHGSFDGRQVIPAGWIDQMLTPSAREENYGFHVWLGYSRPACRAADWSRPFASPDTFMLVGRDEQRVWVVPSHQLVIVRLGRGSADWDDPVLPNLAVDALRQKDQKKSGQLSIPVAP
jgi:CubicO group peptidase (beta-lactamase class C family)